jgi:ribosome-associated translation inhibitor RaiA
MQTPLEITFKNIDVAPVMEQRIRDRIDRLERRHRDLVACRVYVEVPHRSPGSAKNPLSVRIELDIPGRMLSARHEGLPPRELKDAHGWVVNRAFDALENQLATVAAKQAHDVKRHEARLEVGRISRLHEDQRYGFLEVVGSPNLYFTENALHGIDYDDLTVGMMVAFTRATGEGPMGPQANSIRRIGDEERMSF